MYCLNKQVLKILNQFWHQNLTITTAAFAEQFSVVCSILSKGINEDLYIYLISFQIGHETKEAYIFTHICIALFIVNPNHSFYYFILT